MLAKSRKVCYYIFIQKYLKINMEHIDNSSNFSSVSSSPETYEGELINTSTKPIDQMPGINPKSVEGEEFWNRSKVRPESKGPNFNNMPILGFGIKYEGDKATLSVPSSDYLNKVVEKYNLGGFTFEEVIGFEKADDFLSKISHKVFPLSTDKTVKYFGIENSRKIFIYGRDDEYSQESNISLYEHDRVDHLGIAALPDNEADKVANIAKTVLGLEHPSDRAIASGVLDRVLDMVSDYAIAPQPSDEATPENEERRNQKTFLWERVKLQEQILNIHIAVSLGFELHDNPDYDPNLMPEELKQKADAKDNELTLDQPTFDEKIEMMQKLTEDTDLAAQKDIGSLALAS